MKGEADQQHPGDYGVIHEHTAMLARQYQSVNLGLTMKHFIPANLKRVVVYLQPISMRWGTTKLRALCRDELGIEPDSATAFLFVNKGHDSMMLYSTDSSGDRTLTKKVEKGALMMPAPRPGGEPFIIMRPSILSRMFRS